MSSDDARLRDENICPANILSDENSSVSGVDNNLSEDTSLDILQPKALNDVTNNSISIPMAVYRKLCQDSIDLLRSKKTINKLTNMVQKKDAEIKKFKERKAHLSLVSCYV